MNIEILAYEDTPLGPLCLRRRRLLADPGIVVTEVTLDHEFLMSSRNTASERALSSSALAMHGGADLEVLIGGLGLGYTAAEALASDRVARAEVVEFLPQVIEWLERGLVPLAHALKSDARLVVTQGDVYDMLASRSPQRKYDLILIDVDHSPDERLAAGTGAFYSVGGLERASGHLKPAGVFGVWTYAENDAFAAALRSVFAEVAIEPVACAVEQRSRHDRDGESARYTDWLYLAKTARR